MNILLFSANTLTEPYPVYPIGLDYVANAIPPQHEVKIVDLNNFQQSDLIKPLLIEFQPDLVGISLRNIDNVDAIHSMGFIQEIKALIQRIKSMVNAKIIMGGSGFSIFPEELMDLLEIDYGIVGEGERLALLIAAIENQHDPAGIPGILTQNQKQNTSQPWDRPFKREFSKQSHTDFYLNNGGMLNLQTKRGCSFACVYCTYPLIEGSRLRLIDPQEVAEEAWRLQNAGAKYIWIVDSIFNNDFAHSLAVAKAFQKKQIHIPWGAYFAPFKTPDGYYQQLAEAGLRHVEFGTESLCDEQLKNYKKPFRLDQVYQAHKDALSAGLYVAHFLMLGGPGENQQTLETTITNGGKLQKTVLFCFCGVRIYPKTALHDLAIAEGVCQSSDNLLDPIFYHSHLISKEKIISRLQENSQTHPNWVVGGINQETVNILQRLYASGKSGPLWEFLIR